MKASQVAVWLCGLTVAVSAWAQTSRTVYIDPMSNDGPANWNNLPFNSLNASMFLVDSLTNGTGIRATVKTRLNGANTNASASPTGDAAEFAPAGTNSAYGHTVTWSGVQPIPFGEVVFSNLNPTVAYTFTFYASRISVGNIRDARYIITGANSGNAVLNASNNSSTTVTVADIYPDAAGAVTLRIEPGPDNNDGNGFYYITAMKFVYTEPSPTVAYVDANNAGTLAGWNVLNVGSASAATLFATNGAATGIRALVTTPLGNATSWGTYTHTGDAAEFAPAGIDGSWAGSGAVGIINLYNLKPSVPYTFTFFACRPGVTDTREATYSVLGANAASNTLDAASNTDQVAVVPTVLPKADGTLTIRINRGPNNTGNYIYLTAFKVSYVDNGLPLPDQTPIAGKRLLFMGNQYLSTENVPGMVANLAAACGFPQPLAIADFGNDRTLANQLTRVSGAADWNVNHPLLHGTNTWDHLIIQGRGDEPTSLGDPAAYRANALALYQAVKTHATGKGAGCGALLLQTWARGTGADLYPATYASPDAMQAAINAVAALATNDIAAAEGAASVRLAPAGQAFATGAFAPDALYAPDLHTPGKAGPELVALAIVKTLYGVNATDIPYEAANAAGVNAINERDWQRITHWADGLPAPEIPQQAPGARQVLLLDACGNPAGSPVYMGWNYLSFTATGQLANMVLTNGQPTGVSVQMLDRMSGSSAQSVATPTGDAAVFTKALANNAFGNINPWGTYAYSNEFCVARFSGLSPTVPYTFTCYASRENATGRETRYIVEGANSGTALLEPGNNSSQVAVLAKIRPRPDGTIDLKITAGPNNTSPEKFYHINAVMLESSPSGTMVLVE